jgi:hypothetical protein
MNNSVSRAFLRTARTIGFATLALTACITSTLAADHGDGPYASVKRSGDLNDLYLFLDPNDNTRIVTILTAVGFTVPGEGVNLSVFDSELVFEFQYETNGNAEPDKIMQVRFSRKRNSGVNPQIATVTLPNGKRFRALTTPSNLTATPTPPTVTEDSKSGIKFFAGSADDPFFFDIPGFNRFVSGVLSNNPGAASALTRGRDTFAGYNTLAIAMSMPLSTFKGLRNNTLGATARVFNATVTDEGKAQIDRVGNPAVNVALVPFNKKDAYNRGSPQEDAAGKFSDGIVKTLKALGTNDTNIGTLATLAVAKGDYVRVNTTIANTGNGGGDNAQAAFPNGRRPGDDVIDTIIGIVTNGAITTGDNADGNDVPRRDVFPFLGDTHQPRNTGAIDDLTRN